MEHVNGEWPGGAGLAHRVAKYFYGLRDGRQADMDGAGQWRGRPSPPDTGAARRLASRAEGAGCSSEQRDRDADREWAVCDSDAARQNPATAHSEACPMPDPSGDRCECSSVCDIGGPVASISLAEIWAPTSARLSQLLHARRVNPSVAEEIIQEVALRILVSGVRYTSAADLWPWASTVAGVSPWIIGARRHTSSTASRSMR